jgi:recombinational DNA repair protein RecT
MSGYIRDTVYRQLSKIGVVVIPPEQITAIANTVKSSISIPDVTGKIDKVSGKGLSTNDLTNDLKTSYDNAVTKLNSQTIMNVVLTIGTINN